MNSREKYTYDRLVQKAQEAFLLSIELYNRPTIKYHVEGCAFFLCNAWELMLKAHLVEREGLDAIYYPGNVRTLSLEDCLKKVFTNAKDPLRKNMEKVVDVRNTSAHFVVAEYEGFYGPILQACVENFDRQARKLLGIEISDLIPENYLVLSVRKSGIDEDECRARYDPLVLEKMLEKQEGILTMADELDNRKFSCTYVTELRSTKKDTADHTFRLAQDGDTAVALVKVPVEIKNKYPYRPGGVVKAICERLSKGGIALRQDGVDTRMRTKGKRPFNLYMFGLFTSFYDMKGDARYSYNSALEGEAPAYIYSQQAVDLIWDKIRENPEGVIDRLKDEVSKRPKPTPGAKEF